MLVTPRPGVNRDNLLKALQSAHNDVLNLRGGGGPSTAHKRLLAYLEWTSNAVRMLGNQISSADLAYLVLTKRYELLLSGAGTLTGTEMEAQRVVNGLVSLELDQRVEAFDAAIKALQGQIKRWSGSAHLVVPDTSFYIQHQDKLEDADFASLIKLAWTDHPIHVLAPVVIVDELDRLRKVKTSTSDGAPGTRWECWIRYSRPPQAWLVFVPGRSARQVLKAWHVAKSPSS
jgi:hypothetical protein